VCVDLKQINSSKNAPRSRVFSAGKGPIVPDWIGFHCVIMTLKAGIKGTDRSRSIDGHNESFDGLQESGSVRFKENDNNAGSGRPGVPFVLVNPIKYVYARSLLRGGSLNRVMSL